MSGFAKLKTEYPYCYGKTDIYDSKNSSCNKYAVIQACATAVDIDRLLETLPNDGETVAIQSPLNADAFVERKADVSCRKNSSSANDDDILFPSWDISRHIGCNSSI